MTTSSTYQEFLEKHQDWVFDEIALAIPEYASEIGADHWETDDEHLREMIECMTARAVHIGRHMYPEDNITVEIHNSLLTDALSRKNWMLSKATKSFS